MSFENTQTSASVWTEPLELEGTGTPAAVLPVAPVAAFLPGLGLVVLAGVVIHRRRQSSASAV
ncbi:MAG: hypothetical protein ABSE77_20205 [Acidimicrobiales bacterium]